MYFTDGVAARSRLLKEICRDANAAAISRRHPESEIDSLDVEFILRLLRTLVATILEIGEKNPGKVEGRRCRRCGLSPRGKRNGERCDKREAFHRHFPMLIVLSRLSRSATTAVGRGA